MRILLLLFITLPIVEMWLLIVVGSQIGALMTIALVFFTAMVGLALLRQQGFSTLTRARHRMQNGELPAQEMIEGLCLAVGGALLLTPGFFTDGIGFCFLLPGVRQILVIFLLKRFQPVSVSSKNDYGDTIEGKFERDDE